MHIIEFHDTPEVTADGAIKPGRYITEDNNGSEMMLIYQKYRPTMTPYKPVLHAVNDKILIVGTMGFGDGLALTPVLREMKHRNAKAEIHLSCYGPNRQVFFNLPYVDGFVDYPPKLELAQDFGQILFLEGAVEFNLMAKTMHLTDRFAQHLGLRPLEGKTDWTDNKKPEFVLSTEEKEWAAKQFERNPGKRRLGIQVQAGVRCRSYPMSQLAGNRQSKIGVRRSVLADLVANDWEICLLGNPGEFHVADIAKGVLDMTQFKLTFRQTAAFLTSCDAVLAPDSSMMHLAGTLDIPCIALFGPFPAKLRTAYYKTVYTLNGGGKCKMAPCFHAHHQGLPLFPAGGPCEKSGICEELAAIEPERIQTRLEKLIPKSVVPVK